MQTTQSQNSFKKTTLDNGLRIVTCELPHTRSVSISVFVGVGSRHETEERAGIAHFTEHLLFKGTKRRPTAREISVAVEGVGGIMNAGTEPELTVFWCKVASAHFEESLDLIIDMLRNSRIDPAELDKERQVVLEELSLSNDYPNYRVDSLMDAMLWPDHPLGRDIAGTKESVSRITRDMVLDHTALHYCPANIVVSVAGNVPHDDVVKFASTLCDGWMAGATPSWAPYSDEQSATKLTVEYRSTDQDHLSIGLPVVSMTHPDRYAVDLISVILGEGMSSRLFLRVREELGLAYDIQCGVSHFEDCGALVINASVNPKRIYEAVGAILSEVSRVKEAVDEDELDKAKRFSVGRLMLSMEDSRAISGWIGAQELLRGNVIEADEVADYINRVTTQDIQRVARDLLVTSKLNLAVVGPIRGQKRLEKLLSL